MKNTIVQEIASFGTGLRSYLRVLGALFRREEEIRRHAPLEAIMNLLEPLFLLGMIEGARFLVEKDQTVSPLGGNSALFYATGVTSHFFFVYLSRGMTGPIRSPVRRFSIEQRLDHIIVHVALRIIDYGSLAILVFVGMYLFVTPAAFPASFEPIIEACIAMAAFGFSWGVVTVVLSRLFWPFAYFAGPFNRGLSIFSGVFFLPDTLPPGIRYILSFNPMLHAIALLREGFYPMYNSILLSKPYLFGSVLFMLVFSLALERTSRRLESS